MKARRLFFGWALTLLGAAAGAACALGSTEARSPESAGASPAPAPAVPRVDTAEQAAATPMTRTLELRWSPDGAGLLVGDGWLLAPANGAYTRLPCPFTGAGATAACDASAASFSPDGRRVLRVSGEDLAIETLPAASGPPALPAMRARIPNWVKPHTTAAAATPAAPQATGGEGGDRH